MGDLSAEPSMEEILSSIKRIIAEEGEATPRGRRPVRPAAIGSAAPATFPSTADDDDDGVLELSDPMPAPRHDPEPRVRAAAAPAPAPITEPDPIISRDVAAASRGSLDQLSRLMVRPEPGSDGSLEGLVREMLRPMLRDWLDANLPALVETMVAREIKRITGAPE